MKKSCYTDSQILSILRQAEAGTPAPELCREHGMSSATSQVAAKYGGMAASLMARMKELEEVKRRLKKMYAEERLKAEIIQEDLKVVTPSARRAMAKDAVARHQVSINGPRSITPKQKLALVALLLSATTNGGLPAY